MPEVNGKLESEISSIKPEIEPLSWRFWRKRRYIVVLMAFFGIFNMFSLRINLSVGIVAMTENRTIHYDNGTIDYVQDFPWSSTERGLVLSSFFWGYITTQLLGGILASKYGGNIVFGIGISVTSILTLLTPLAAKIGLEALITVRVIEGIFEGMSLPCLHAVWAKWSPPFERSRMVSISAAGSFAGTIISMPASGILAEKFGWESLFYVFGVIGIVWCLFWAVLVRNSPDEDKYISKDELRYIQGSIGTTENIKVKHPWRDILRSKPFYAIAASQFAENWGFTTLITQLPAYLKDTLGYNLEKSGYLSAAPFLGIFLSSGIVAYFADFLQIKGYLTTTQVRKYFNCGAFIGQAIFLLAAGYSTNPTLCIIFIIIAVSSTSFAMCGFQVNHLDIAPQHASVLMGLSNTFANLAGVISPALTGFILTNSTIEEWRIVFMISSGIYLFGCVVYWFWSSGELQPWAKKSEKQINSRSNTTAAASTDFSYSNEGAEVHTEITKL